MKIALIGLASIRFALKLKTNKQTNNKHSLAGDKDVKT